MGTSGTSAIELTLSSTPSTCDLDVDTTQFSGTTRQRFTDILASLPPRSQAKVLRGVLERFPVDAAGRPPTSEDARVEILQWIARLERAGVPNSTPHITSEVVQRALADAEHLLSARDATSAVDRVHTALHGYVLAACDQAGIGYKPDSSMTALFRALRLQHPALHQLGPRQQDIEKVLNACANILDAMSPVRNKASVAHPNAALLADAEARLVINVGRTLLSYLDAKLAQ